MRVLAIDTAFDACSAAILDNGRVMWTESRAIGRGHAEVLPAMVAEGLRAAGAAAFDIDRVGVVIGPGAFAGLRVGLAFARGFCIGTRARAVGISSTKALAASAAARAPALAAAFDARRGEIYAALYLPDLEEQIAPFVAPPEAAARRIAALEERPILAGSGAPLLAPFLPSASLDSRLASIDPAAVARLAAAADEPIDPPAPLYLRPPDTAPSAASLFDGVRP
jgi:tRNA threonylcarbamoyladenosine biosynthesis protein TsaB